MLRPNNIVEKTPDELAIMDLRGANDSIQVINSIITANTHTEVVYQRIDANYRHLQLVLQRDHVISYVANTGYNLTSVNDAIANGRAYLTGTDYDPVVLDQQRQEAIAARQAQQAQQATSQ